MSALLPFSTISLFSLSLISLHILLFNRFYKLTFPRNMSSYVTLAASNLRGACNRLISQAFSKPSARDVPEVVHPELSIARHQHKTGSSEVECSVCLCKIEDGDEIRRLRCDHLFHRVCLDRWLGYKNPTCPLCREYLAPLRAITELGMEVLSFKFSSSRSPDRETWWLR